MDKIVKSTFILAAVVFMAVGSSGAYLSDTVVVTGNQFSTGTWATNVVINEVYYYTGTRTFNDNQNSKTEEEGKNEWIELYNPTSAAINLKDWSITDNSGLPHVINENSSIPSHGFAILSHDNDTWKFWPATDVEKINLGGDPGSDWLANTGDHALLKNDAGVIVDEMSYGTGGVEGHSLERKTPGFDTDAASDFIDKSTPTPGAYHVE